MLTGSVNRLSLPKHFLVALSAWGSRVIIVVVQVLSVRILISSLGLEQYAVFALMLSLSGWYALADFGVGVSIQNYLSTTRSKRGSEDGYIVIAGILAIFLLLITTGLIYFSSSYLGPIFLKNFNFIESQEKADQFWMVSQLLIVANISGIAYKIWYAQHKGYWSSLVPAFATVTGFGGLILVSQSDSINKLYLSLMVYLLPSAVLPMLVFIGQFTNSFNYAKIPKVNYFLEVLKRASHFWFFGIMAACVLQIDYVVLSQFMKSQEIAVYNIAVKVFGLAFFIYQAVLAALWPVFSEAIANHKWDDVKKKMRGILCVGLLFMALATISLFWLMPFAFHFLAPSSSLDMSIALMSLFGFYYMVRVWTDTFAMLLQSMNDLRPFWIYVPIQALVSIIAQWILAPSLGLYGILLGLLISFLLTVSWALPVATKRHYMEYQRKAI